IKCSWYPKRISTRYIICIKTNWVNDIPNDFRSFYPTRFCDLGQLIPEKLQEHGVSQDDIPKGELDKISGQSYADIQSSIEQIPSEEARGALQAAFNEAAQNAYQPIYFSAVISAVIIMVLALLFHKQFKQDAKEEEDKESET